MLFSLRLLSKLTFAFPDILSAFSLFSLIIIRNFISELKINKLFPKIASGLSILSLLATLIYSSFNKHFDTGLFVYNSNLEQIKIILLFVVSVFFIYLNNSDIRKTIKPNFFIFIYGIINAIMLCLSANHFIILILGLELYTFSLAFLIISEDLTLSSGKCMIRFLLTSSVMTAIFVFGCSIIYSQFGSLSFSKIVLNDDFASILGGSLIMTMMMFKLGVAPFHSWMLDVYEKSPTIVVMFLDAIWKFFMTFIFVRVFQIMLSGTSEQFRLILSVLSIISMLLGSIVPIFQNNIHKFIASASVGHMGFILSVFAISNTTKELSVIASYLVYYAIASICFFLGLMIISKWKNDIKTFFDIGGIINTSPILGFLILLSMFAMIGVPPFGNFIAKLNIFEILIKSKNYPLLITAMIYSVISIAYVIKWGRFLFKNRNIFPTYVQGNLLASSFLIAILSLSIFIYNKINSFFCSII